MGVWDQIRDALRAMWTDLQGPNINERTQLKAWLTEAWRTERRLGTQLRQVAAAVPYEQFRKRLEAMAHDDDRHAELLSKQLEVTSSVAYQPAGAMAPNRNVASPWRRLLGVLQEKRDLYERYRQEAVFLDDANLQALLQQIRDEEARHQEQLIEMLTHLDAHVHETIA